jgi:hypothetical protein
MHAERAFISMLLVAAMIGLAFVGLAAGHAVKVGDVSALMRHPLLGSGAASLGTAILGGLFRLTLRPRR